MLIRRLKTCTSGNVALLFGLAMLPAAGLAGLALDYANASSVSTRLQTAIDSTALALAHSSIDLTQQELQKKADEIFALNFPPGGDAEPGPVKVKRGGDYVSVDASAKVETRFLKLLNVDALEVGGHGKVVWGSVNVEVVLALDNTGSMAGTKLAELKKAAKELIDTLEGGVTNAGSVKIGLVPFATTVRVDPDDDDYRDAEWIRFDDVRHWYQNREGRWKSRMREFNKNAWQGCIQDRDQPYDVDDTAYDDKTQGQTLYPAIETCPDGEQNLAMVQPLTANFGVLRTAIDGMEAAGQTNVTIGIAWALSLLSSQAPFTEGVPPDQNGSVRTEKYMIILTDGENTQNRFSSNTDVIDGRTKEACKAAKDAGVVFTVRMIDGDEDLLRECASEGKNYYDVENAAKLTPAFKSIAQDIAKLRLSD